MKKTTKNNILQVITPTKMQQIVNLAKKTSKKSYTNLKYIEKGLITYYINKCWVKNLKLRKKYALKKIKIYGLQKNL